MNQSKGMEQLSEVQRKYCNHSFLIFHFVMKQHDDKCTCSSSHLGMNTLFLKELYGCFPHNSWLELKNVCSSRNHRCPWNTESGKADNRIETTDLRMGDMITVEGIGKCVGNDVENDGAEDAWRISPWPYCQKKEKIGSHKNYFKIYVWREMLFSLANNYGRHAFA